MASSGISSDRALVSGQQWRKRIPTSRGRGSEKHRIPTVVTLVLGSLVEEPGIASVGFAEVRRQGRTRMCFKTERRGL